MPKKLTGQETEIPSFDFSLPRSQKSQQKLTLFDLSSHDRAREALNFGLEIKEPEFNIFVIGEDRTGRLSGTVSYIQRYQKKFSPVDDWVYLYNFDFPEEPLPFRFPNGKGKEFSHSLNKVMRNFVTALVKNFNAEEFTKELSSPGKSLEKNIQEMLEDLRSYALSYNIDLARNADGTISPVKLFPQSKSQKKELTSSSFSEVWEEVRERLHAISLYAENETEKVTEKIEFIKQNEAEALLNPLMNKYLEKYKNVQDLSSWLEGLRSDILKNLNGFVNNYSQENISEEENIIDRYKANVLVQSPKNHPPLVVEPNPTYENLFGKITYKYASNGYITNFSMISAGSLHRANGGVLILRADALAMNPESWKYLKYALRDRVTRIEELHRTNAVPLSEAPKPKEIPLDLKVIIIGSPLWFYNYFYQDQDFKTYFKIKADISPYFEANHKNLSTIAKMLLDQTLSTTKLKCTKKALSYVLGYGSRMAEHRRNLSSRLEALMDIIYEASTFIRRNNKTAIDLESIKQAISMRTKRDALIQEQSLEMIEEGVLKISTEGMKIGQVNGLTVQEVGGYSFGLPTRISAQSSIGTHGIINIEHMVEMSGSIQHKGVLILEGFLRGIFAQKFPLSCHCSITFEQTYVGVDGDSASAAELCAILSSLSGVPLRQGIALTGAINQFGDSLAVGGINEKIEGFYKICHYQGLDGQKGVIIPHSNESNIILDPEVSEAVAQGKFHIWSIQHVTEALDLLTLSGYKDVFKKTEKVLERFDQILSRRPLARAF